MSCYFLLVFFFCTSYVFFFNVFSLFEHFTIFMFFLGHTKTFSLYVLRFDFLFCWLIFYFLSVTLFSLLLSRFYIFTCSHFHILFYFFNFVPLPFNSLFFTFILLVSFLFVTFDILYFTFVFL